MGTTNQHYTSPDQFGICDSITNLATTNFKLLKEHEFCIDNENDEAVFLEVKFLGMDTFILKKIYPGVNPFLLKEIKVNTTLTAPQLANLKYGY